MNGRSTDEVIIAVAASTTNPPNPLDPPSVEVTTGATARNTAAAATITAAIAAVEKGSIVTAEGEKEELQPPQDREEKGKRGNQCSMRTEVPERSHGGTEH